ncbi:MAG TPA: prepilin-type N-terminal cleavage/methylation domain-containing protein [Tepidisphaeraceae bacterium]|jgi:type II secretory pathway pseudopilin PulG|nr:prepilin-type N-terminal cleavage/methylation domain-containing protein [Tepidisphaeraceae bacterium]
MTTKTSILTPASRSAAAFTLIELMISMALALLLLLGVNYVFRTTQQTVSTGMALSTALRSQNSVADVIRNDFQSVVSSDSMPALVIHSNSVYAFQDANDQHTDPDGLVKTAKLNPNTGTDSDAVPTTSTNKRYHRVDTLSFFATGNFLRQTGQPASASPPLVESLVSDQSSKQAWIWYGHAALPDNTATNYYGPGEPDSATTPAYISNPGTYTGAYASNWILSRVAILLTEPDSITGQIYDNNNNPQVFLTADTNPPTGVNVDPLWPLAYNARSTSNSTSPSFLGTDTTTNRIQDSAYDLSGTSINTFYNIVAAASDTAPFPNVYTTALKLTSSTYTPFWWWGMVYQPTTPTAYTFSASPLTPSYRFSVNPTIPKPFKPSDLAKTTPAFQAGVTQFIVEFAGDFVTQDNNPANTTYGDLIAPTSSNSPGDGQIDYIVTKAPTPTTPGERQIRWYGAPRDVSSGSASAATYSTFPDGTVDPKIDVVPISSIPNYSLFASSYKYDVAYNGFEKQATGSVYTFAWGPLDKIKPKMIRVTIETVDPQGRLTDSRVQQYIMTLK